MFEDSAGVSFGWNPNATEFEDSTSYHKTHGDLIASSKPISELLGKADSIKFLIFKDEIIVKSGNR